MRRFDEHQIDPEIAAALDAIDATLAGEPVDPRHAELAELALLLAEQRPRIDPAGARALDDRVSQRFARGRRARVRGGRADAGAAAAADVSAESASRRHPSLARPRLAWDWLAVGGGLVTAIVGVVAVVVVLSNGSPGRSGGVGTSGQSAAAASGTTAHVAGPSPAPHALAPSTAASSAQSSATANLQPPPNGRKVVQSAQLALSAAPTRVDDVAQEVFQVVGAQSGIVERSDVTQTGGSDGDAFFQLSLPSATLEQTMAKLSDLQYAGVSSRTDTTQDVNDQYDSVTRSLADARALRTALLKQLANALTTQQVESLRAQINDAEASISSDQATLRTLNHQISFSAVSVTINAASVPPVAARGGGFTIGKGAHDAGRVLTVAAAVALIVLAVLVPVGLLVALGWWVGGAVRRRRREHALDRA